MLEDSRGMRRVRLASGLARLRLGTLSGTRAERFYLSRRWRVTGMDGSDILMEFFKQEGT